MQVMGVENTSPLRRAPIRQGRIPGKTPVPVQSTSVRFGDMGAATWIGVVVTLGALAYAFGPALRSFFDLQQQGKTAKNHFKAYDTASQAKKLALLRTAIEGGENLELLNGAVKRINQLNNPQTQLELRWFGFATLMARQQKTIAVSQFARPGVSDPAFRVRLKDYLNRVPTIPAEIREQLELLLLPPVD